MLSLEIATSEKFNALHWSHQKFLFDLHVVFHDCERFTIDLSAPQQYRQMRGASIARKIKVLVEEGFLEIVGTQKAKFSPRRVFRFPQPPDCQVAIATSGTNNQPQHI